MTKDEALNIAIDYMNERLEEHDAKFQRHPATEAERNNILADIETVKEALAQPEQEPVAWAFLNGQYAHIVWGKQRPDDEIHTTPLYTNPPPVAEPHKRKPLTDEEINLLWRNSKSNIGWEDFETVVREIEAVVGKKQK
jgi:hypothetical protein